MTTLADLITQWRAKAEPEIGLTHMDSPQTNKQSPMVQATLPPLAGLAELHDKLEELQNGYDVNLADCDQLEVTAALIGEARRTNQPAIYESIFIGATGTSIPANTALTDAYGDTWTTEKAVSISGGVGFGTVRSPSDAYTLSSGELSLQSSIEGVTLATNGAILQEGFEAETCEQFRARLLNGELSPEQSVIAELEKIADSAKFIENAPDCISPVSNVGFVVDGGDDAEIAEIIRKYAPLNYATLAGKTSVEIGCETVRFIRPCVIEVQVKYWGSEVPIDDIRAAIESGGLESVSSINCIQSVEFATSPQASDECPCDDIASSDFSVCPTIESWHKAVLVSAERVGGKC